MILQLIIIFCIFISIQASYRIVSYNGKTYLLNHGSAHLIASDITVESLGYHHDSIPTISHEEFTRYKLGEEFPLIENKHENPDQITAFELLKNKLLQGRLMVEKQYIGEFINPAVVLFKGRLFTACGLGWGIVDGKKATEMLEFRWLNHSTYSFSSSEPYLGVSSNQLNYINNTKQLLGQDPRLIVLDENRMFLSFTNRFFRDHIRMGYAILTYNSIANIITADEVYSTIYPSFDQHQHHKNWAPFLYHNEILMISTVNPFVVVNLRIENNVPVAYRNSSMPVAKTNWDYGELRGGSNAILIGDRYLAFFHSSTNFPGNYFKTYVMGAFTFTATSPFRLLEMSPYPILDDDLYTNDWAVLKNRRLDYVVFPSTIELRGEDIIMSFGRNDHQGYLGKLKLKQILDSLEPVTY